MSSDHKAACEEFEQYNVEVPGAVVRVSREAMDKIRALASSDDPPPAALVEAFRQYYRRANGSQ